ncbi:protein atonal homolog 8-like [Elysia marginata]|uniref:Protein atonal homolog 8-like n=1 Tax=Elysia marginata TaxID=1093978 RepID=A0AAV4GXA7_9GAST|nr:protein atonal homolog 8-like [Elysia marginata]
MVTTIMASAKLVKVHTQHHHHHNHISPSRHHGGGVVTHQKNSAPLAARACLQSPAMTLDYSLPRGRDLEAGSPPRHGLDIDPSQPQRLDSKYPDFSKDVKGLTIIDSHSQHASDDTDRYDPYLSPPPSSQSQAAEDHDTLADTPTKKNKRKLSSPRRRADVSDDEAPPVKEPKRSKERFLDTPASPMGEDEDSGIDSYKSVDDTVLDVVGGSCGSVFEESPSSEKTNMRVNEKRDSGPTKKATALSGLSAVPSSSPSSPSSSLIPGKRTSISSSTSKTKSKKKSSLSNKSSPRSVDVNMPGASRGGRMSRKHRKNYKNMTRERRVEANARERTRVHTISAAFEALRRAVPSYSHNQKLSKLAILRIACSYIMSLARLGDMDYTSASEHIGQPLNFAECVEMTTNTIQTEGRARRRH